jgi:hypothetical protein
MAERRSTLALAELSSAPRSGRRLMDYARVPGSRRAQRDAAASVSHRDHGGAASFVLAAEALTCLLCRLGRRLQLRLPLALLGLVRQLAQRRLLRTVPTLSAADGFAQARTARMVLSRRTRCLASLAANFSHSPAM